MYKQKEVTIKSGRTVILRQPTLNDAQTFADFINGLVKEETFEYAGPQTLKDEEEYIEFLLSEINENKGVHIIAEYNGEKIAGADMTNCGYKKEHVFEVELFVRNDFRGEGLGTMLLQELENEVKKLVKITMITLNVFGNNDGAIRLYNRFGYEECGRIPKALNYKRELVDEVTMYKFLK